MGDRYEIKDRIGRGGLGEVYRAIDNQLKREVALKRLLPPGEGEAQDVDPEDLLTEATTLSSLQHPNIVSVYDVGQDDQGAFVVMELLKGETFDETVERGALNERDFRSVVTQTMEALVAAHHSDIIHRDLKPSNLMVNWLPSGKFQIKILDFGLAKFSKTPEVQTTDQGDAILGSIYFMAPEQFERVPLDPRTDLYSMGSLYHYCLTGQYPFDGENAPQVMAAHLQHRVHRIHDLRPDLPIWMCDWVMWLISRDMSERPATAKEALDCFHEERCGGKVTPPPTSGAQVMAVAPAQAAPPPGMPIGGNPTVPLATGVPGGPPQAPKAPFPVPVWAMITIPVLLITLMVVYFTKSGAKKLIDDRNARIAELNQAEVPRGDGDSVEDILDFMGDQDKSDTGRNNVIAALTTLVRLRGNGVDSALLEAAEKGPKKFRAGLLGVLIQRETPMAIPLMLKNLDNEDSEVSDAAIYGLGVLGGGKNITKLIDELRQPKTEKIGSALVSAIIQISRRDPDFDARAQPIVSALGSADGQFKRDLLQILGSMGGDSAWGALEKALSGGELEDRKAALRGVTNWPDGMPADRMFKIATSDSDGVIRGMALRAFAYLALAPAPVPEEKRLEQVKEVLGGESVARSTKRELLQVLASMASPAAKEYAESLADDPQLGSYSEMLVEEISDRSKKRKAVAGDGILLRGSEAVLLGEGDFKYEPDAAAVVGWTNLAYSLTWPLEFAAPGTYELIAKVATPPGGGGEYAVTLGASRLVGETPKGDRFIEKSLGDVEITEAGTYRLSVEGASAEDETAGLMQLRSVELKAK